MTAFIHKPVMEKEVVEIFTPKRDKVFVDGTCGLGGHAKALLDAGAKVIAIDRDQKALQIAKDRLKKYQNIHFSHGNFVDLDQVLKALKIEKVDGVLLDLGISSMQLDDKSRGFSFKNDQKLDMRYDQNQSLTAEKVINQYSEADLRRIFQDFGEEPEAKTIARAIVEMRAKKPIETTAELVDIIRLVLPTYRLHQKIHFATHIFRSLRMEVNAEVDSLIRFFEKAPKMIKPGGRLVIISFHSIEDRIVKRGFQMLKLEKRAKILTKKPLNPSQEEIKANVRARSAHLRACEMI
jgi:16S rRNA (cytosine1402-N4)-methyltransferase